MKWYVNKTVLIWRFTLVLIKINYGQIGDQTGLFYTVFFAKYDRGLDLSFWENWNLWNGQILQAFSWSGWKDPLKFVFLCEFK
jgi:hypothetical protein